MKEREIDVTKLEEEFDQAMFGAYERARDEAGYKATVFSSDAHREGRSPNGEDADPCVEAIRRLHRPLPPGSLRSDRGGAGDWQPALAHALHRR
jgi:hypothetical protein